MLDELKNFKVHTILVLENQKIDDDKSICEIFHLSAKLIVNDSDIHKAFGIMHESVMTNKILLAKIGFLKQLLKMRLRFLSVSIAGNNSIEK